MIPEKLWVMMGVMIIMPLFFYILLPDPYATIGIIGSNIGMLFFLRKTFKNIVSGKFGNQTKFTCSVCGFSKFNQDGSCKRCGNKMRKVS